MKIALPTKAKIAALVCSGRSRPYERTEMPDRNAGNTSFNATTNPTRKATIPQNAVAAANFRTMALS